MALATGPDQQEQSHFYGARHAREMQAYNAELAKRLNGDLTPRQLRILACVNDRPGCSQTDIVGATGIDRSTLADIVRRMQRKGLLQRHRTKEDARTYAVKLTPAGSSALRPGLKAARKLDDELGLDAQAKSKILSSLQRKSS